MPYTSPTAVAAARLPDRLLQGVRRAARAADRTTSGQLRYIVREWLRQQGDDTPADLTSDDGQQA